MSLIAIASYKAKPGHEKAFNKIIDVHVPLLQKQGYVTDKPPYRMNSENGTIIEVFEWESKEKKERAHEDPKVASLWNQFFDHAEMVPLDSLKEAHHPFATFKTSQKVY